MDEISKIFTEDVLTELFPSDRADNFFDALFGDASEGAYDIILKYNTYVPEEKELHFELHLIQRPGKCLACNLTYGLPEVFSRHPIINIKGLVGEIDKKLDGKMSCLDGKLKSTRSVSSALHIIPLVVKVQ
ncbi:MAG: pancreas/duodenum homeobox protein 1 [Desulfobulbaceae bacterium]|nr:pancreas/duodenum homeobox protein 1 [Desulfobulbaceae bacterium]